MTQLGIAYERGLGQIVEGEIEMIGERLDDLVVEWDRAVLRNQLGVRPFGAPAYAAQHHRKIRRHA